MKTCNGGYCEFKVQNGSLWGCLYGGNCEHQCPRESPYWQANTVQYVEKTMFVLLSSD